MLGSAALVLASSVLSALPELLLRSGLRGTRIEALESEFVSTTIGVPQDQVLFVRVKGPLKALQILSPSKELLAEIRSSPSTTSLRELRVSTVSLETHAARMDEKLELTIMSLPPFLVGAAAWSPLLSLSGLLLLLSLLRSRGS